MVPHDKEKPKFTYSLEIERQALRDTKKLRRVPDKAKNKLLAATWNLTNFGAQKRSNKDLALMAEAISWFDLIAIQEIADDLSHLRLLMKRLPTYKVIISDVGGNDERAGFLYDSATVERLELAAEVAVSPSDLHYIRMKGVSGSFQGFDRNPYLVAFRAGNLEFTAVCVHLFFGSDTYYDEDRRALEAYALSRWADQRHKSPGAYSQNILVMGDFNLPFSDERSHVYEALRANRLILPKHSTAMGSSLKDDKAYDQVAFQAGGMQDSYVNSGVFDFDNEPFFADAWKKSLDYFNTTVKYHIADHRPLWAAFKI
jgi:endonuclease/exonuclease/phosphatase family metal-dependent hydrolase